VLKPFASLFCRKKMKSLLLTTIIMTGVVDQVHDRYAVVEYRSHSNNELRYMDVPLEMIPCRASEGTQVFLSHKNDTVKIICSK